MELTVHNYYRYVHPEYLDFSLICQICRKPWIEPQITPCQNTFCRSCIFEWIEENYSKCPSCPQSLLENQLIPLTDQTTLVKLDQLHVESILCHHVDIERGMFTDHLQQTCPKAVVTCSMKENDCPWIGLREEFECHRTSCSFRCSEVKTHDNEESLEEDVYGQFLPLSKIHLNQRIFHNQDIAIAVKALIINKRCTNYDLFHRGITSEGASMIASVLENDRLVETLAFRNNFICDTGVQALAHVLSTNMSYLQRLDLNSNAITDTGVRLLVDMLRINKTLIKLTLSFNRITNEGMEMFIDALINDNSTLQWLSLAGNVGITDHCTHSIVRLLGHNHSLKTLNLENCSFSWLSKKHLYFSRRLYWKSDFELIFE